MSQSVAGLEDPTRFVKKIISSYNLGRGCSCVLRMLGEKGVTSLPYRSHHWHALDSPARRIIITGTMLENSQHVLCRQKDPEFF